MYLFKVIFLKDEWRRLKENFFLTGLGPFLLQFSSVLAPSSPLFIFSSFFGDFRTSTSPSSSSWNCHRLSSSSASSPSPPQIINHTILSFFSFLLSVWLLLPLLPVSKLQSVTTAAVLLWSHHRRRRGRLEHWTATSSSLIATIAAAVTPCSRHHRATASKLSSSPYTTRRLHRQQHRPAEGSKLSLSPAMFLFCWQWGACWSELHSASCFSWWAGVPLLQLPWLPMKEL